MATRASAKKTVKKSVSAVETKKTIKKAPSKVKILKTTFKYFARESQEVCLVGSFNGWKDKEFFLKKDEAGYWTISLPLDKGRHEYRYVVDGNWANDQDQLECVPNPFGTWNSVIEVQV